MRGGRPDPKHNGPRQPPARPRPAQALPRLGRHSQFRISEMKTARPRIPSPFDTAGIVARDQGRPATRRTTATTAAATARSPRGAPQAAAAAASAARMRRGGSRAPAGGGRRGCGAPCRAEAAPQRPCSPQPLGRGGPGHPPVRRAVMPLHVLGHYVFLLEATTKQSNAVPPTPPLGMENISRLNFLK